MPAIRDPETYRRILDTLPIGICVVNLEKKIIFWNTGAEQITERPRIEMLGHSCLEKIMTQCNEASCTQCSHQCPLTTVLHTGKPTEGAFSIQHKLGHHIPLHVWTTPLRDGQGLIIGLIQTFDEPRASDDPDPNEETMKAGGFLDEVTELANRAMMQSHLREALVTFAEWHIPFGVVCLETTDINRFRASYGQDATRSMLRVLARTLRNAVWPSDFVGHWSDGQFLAILNGCADAALKAVGERLRGRMAGASIEWWGQELTTAVSIGRAAAQNGDNVESLMERALLAMAENRPTSRIEIVSAVASNSTKS